MKKVLLMIFAVAILVCTTVHAQEINDISIEMQIGQNSSIVNGVETKIDDNNLVVPFVENGRTLVPVRFVSNSLGLDVSWDEHSQKVTLSKGSVEIALMIGRKDAYVNGNRFELDSSPVIVNDRTFVPVRFIAEVFRCDVLWEDESQKIYIKREKETEVDINDEEVQALFEDILNQQEFACFYDGYCDISVFDNSENMFGGTMRELFTFLKLKNLDVKDYTTAEAEAEILDFLSEGDISKSMSSYEIERLKFALENGEKFGADSTEEYLVACYDKSFFDEISVDLFGTLLPEHENLAYLIGYHSFHLFNRVNLFYPYANINVSSVYYNNANKRYLFSNHLDYSVKDIGENTLESETKLIKATRSNGKLSLFIQRRAEYDEYSGGKSTYEGVFVNTYQKGDNGYYWVCSYGNMIDLVE